MMYLTTYIERDKYIEEWIIDLNVERGIINSSTFIHQFLPLESPLTNLKDHPSRLEVSHLLNLGCFKRIFFETEQCERY